MADKKFGLDIGTYNIRISSLESKRFVSEKNAVAIKNDKLIIGCGNDAYDMFEKAPENVAVYFPSKGGVISDISKEEIVLEYIYKKINDEKKEKNATFLIAVPNYTTEVEKRAFYEIIAESRLRPRNISMIDKAIADSIACHIDIDSKDGDLIVNIGADTTDISVVSEGGIVLSKKIMIAGNHISDAIINAVKNSTGRLIGMKSADQLKFEIADLDPYGHFSDMIIYGREIASGLPVKTKITSDIVNGAVEATLRPVADEIKILIDKTPPALASNIKINGIYLVGGTAGLKNIEIFFRKEISLPVNILKDPSNSTIRGVTRALSNSMYARVMYYPEEKGFF